MKKIIASFLLFIFIFNANLFAQVSDSESVDESKDNSSEESSGADIAFNLPSEDEKTSKAFLHENDGKKHWLTAIGGVIFFNVGLATYNRVTNSSEWTQIGPETWDHFWEKEPEWDNDWFWTNCFLHPYQGSVYYQLGRNSNLNYFESFLLSFAGSAMWEYFCETTSPSRNDFIYTPLGAFTLGEMLYRLSLEADEISQIFSHFINPARIWTEPLTRQKPRGTKGNIHEMSLKFTLGTARSYTNIMSSRAYDYESAEIYPVFVSPAFSVVYNDPYGHDSNTPFEQFELDVALALGKGSGHGAVCLYKEFDKQFMYDIRVMGHGMIFARAPRLNENSDTTLGLTMKYEFDWHQFYELSSIGPEFAIKQRRRHENSNIEWQFHAGWNVLGSTDYYYHHRPVLAEFEGRNYSMCTGPMTSLSFRYLSEKGSSLTMGFRGYALYDFEAQIQKNAPETSTGWEFIGVSNLSFEIPLSKIARVGVSDELYMKRAFYKKVPDVFQWLNSVGVFAKMQLK